MFNYPVELKIADSAEYIYYLR